MSKPNYTVYHLHTELSLLDSCTNYKLCIDKAKELNQKAIAFTEHGNIYNWTEKKMYCKENGIKYIHGVEMYLTEQLESKKRDNYHTILLAKNFEGVKELNTLIDLSTHKDHFYYKPRITFDEFFNISDNIIKISACLASPLWQYRKVEGYDKDIYVKLCKAYDYYEIQPHINSKDQIIFNKTLYALSRKFNKPLIAGTDTHNIDKYNAECRSLLQLSKGIEFSNEDEFDLTYKSYDELLGMFMEQNSLPLDVVLEAIENTNVMADSVEDFELDNKVKYPILCDNEEQELKKLINQKLKYKLKHKIIDKKDLPKYQEMIAEEFRVFKKINMIGFMLFMSKLVCWCWDNYIPIGFCRGSCGGSMIAYIIDIIDVNPLTWSTIFSRFANEDREEVGDIDIDVSPDQRHLVYEHIIDEFGSDKTAYILAMGTISEKGTIDEIVRGLKKKFSKENPYAENPYTLDYAKKIKEQYDTNPEETKKKYKDVFYYFDGLINTTISQSMHPAGIVVSPITLTDNFGTFQSGDKQIMCINMEEIHDNAGLVKYDILGLKNIQIIRKCCEYANIPYPKSHEVNWEDEKVWEDIISSPIGIFQFEGDYAFDLLSRYKPHCVNDLSMVNASLRPSGASYRDRLISGEVNKNPSKLIDDLLAENRGYLIFQEDTIKFLQNICGLSGSEADNVRRAIGRKQADRLQKALPKILDGYCNMSDQPREVAEKEARIFLQIIEDSSNYQFGFNHSTGYSMIGYMCAYLRYYYPVEFITAYLNCANTEEDIVGGTELANQKGVTIYPVQFGKSKGEYTSDAENNSIYKGIGSIKFLNNQLGNDLFELAHKRTYSDFTDLLPYIKSETSVNSKQLSILTACNFFSSFGENKYLLNITDIYDKFSTIKQIKKEKLDELGIGEFVAKKFSNKETAKLFKEIDNDGLVKYMCSKLSKDEKLTCREQVKSDIEYLGYTDYSNPSLNSENQYIVISFESYGTNRPYLTLRNLKTGKEVKTRIKNSKKFIENPFDLYSVIEVYNFVEMNKVRKVGDEFVTTDETELILDEFSNRPMMNFFRKRVNV